jgi:hypothetical protein
MYATAIIGICLVVYFGFEVIKNSDNLKGKAAVTIDVLNGTAEVAINGFPSGKTPYSSRDIKPGENKITVKSETRSYETTIDFIANDKKYIYNTGIFRDLGVSDLFSSGQEFWFEKGKASNVVRIVSEPAGASVLIDNNEVGKTPFSSDKISEGEYDLKLDLAGYESQTARMAIHKGYTANVSLKMFPLPVPVKIKQFEGSTGFYDLSTDNPAVSSDTQDWVNAVIYWNKTRGINLEETGINKEPMFDYFVDYKGNLFDKEGKILDMASDLSAVKAAKKSAYLGRTMDGPGITKEAKDALYKLGNISIGKKGTIKQTPTGWLRVRSAAGLSGAEIAKVNVGQEVPVLEEQIGWIKIKVSDTVEGWVSADYITIAQ